MKKSELYKGLQSTVLSDQHIPNATKIEILRELFIQEDLAKMVEEKQEAVEG